MPSIVRIADPRGSAPSPLRLLAAAAGGVALGVLLLKLSLAAPRPETIGAFDSSAAEATELDGAGESPPPEGAEDDGASDAEDRAAAEAPDPQEPSEALPAEADAPAEPGAEEANAVEEALPEVAPGASAAAEAEAETDATGQAGEGGGTLTRGRVAYFQCPEGECPRDHAFERAVWRALERVPGCLGSVGEADVRVTVAAGAVEEVRFRERGAGGIELGVLDRCVTPPLRRVTGSTLGDGTVVSFRFDVR